MSSRLASLHSQEQKLLRRVDEELKQSARKDLWNLVFYIRKNSAVFFLLLLLAPLKELILFSRENECVVICERKKTTGVFATCKICLVLGLFDERPQKSPDIQISLVDFLASRSLEFHCS